MDLSQLFGLGKIAGVPGIALGVVALVLGWVLDVAGVLPEAWRGPVLTAIVAGAVLLGVLAIRAWAGSRAQTARTQGDAAAAINRDRSEAGGPQTATTRGADAPAINCRE